MENLDEKRRISEIGGIAEVAGITGTSFFLECEPAKTKERKQNTKKDENRQQNEKSRTCQKKEQSKTEHPQTSRKRKGKTGWPPAGKSGSRMKLVSERLLGEFRSSVTVVARVVMVQNLNFYFFVHAGKMLG